MSQLKKYKRLKYLGKGSYGAAILVELRSNPSQRFVIKEIVIGHLKPAEQAAAKSEAEVLAQMNHSNITMYIESFVENAKLYIVMENADGGDLSAAIQNRKKDMKYWDEEEVMRIFVQICLALKHVHSANILHRDLKSQNIFLTQKGVVKLGDFGIAKVLDATDEQARTQIGTPYYLSPEICESKPYGRESDVWSLGVLLYELIALEMPFQATSLPALVHRICVAEPNYSVVEKRYSPGLIALTKSMLQKDPQKRPSVSQIVKSDFIKTHISRLLSYTLKVGNGGVDGGNQLPLPLPKPRNINNLDPEEAERCIESVHGQIRAQESKSVISQSNREALRIAEREKLRKFRNDMARARKEPDPDAKGSENSKEDDARVAYKPAPRVAASGRDLSPKNGRPLSPKQMPRPHSPSPKVNRPLSPKARDNSPKGPRNVSPKGRNLSPVNNRAGPSAGGPSGERALTPRSQATQREKDRKMAAAAAMKQGYYDNAESDPQRGYRDARDYQAQRQQAQAAPQQMVVAKSNQGGNEYESAARREFFANRAAAMAVKAKVEAYDRHGGERLSMPLIGGGGAGAVRSHPNSRRGSEVDRDYVQPQPQPLQQLQQGSVYEEPSQERGRYSSYGDDDRSDAEVRIAQIKAQREKDREREIAQKEQQIKQAMEANRDARRSVQGNKSAVAFDIDLGGNNAAAAKAPPVIARERVRQSLDDKPAASPMTNQSSNSPYSVQSESSSVAGSAKVRSAKEDKDVPAEAESNKSKAKKGWGPPVSGGDIAKGVVRYSEYSTPTSQMFAPERDAGNAGNGGNASVSSSTVDKDQYFEEESSVAEESRQQAHRRDFSRDSIDAMSVAAAEEDQTVLRRLESKRNSQIEARQQAKEVFKKLREQRRKESELKTRRPSYSDATVSVQHGVVSPVKKINPTDGAFRAADASPMQVRLMEVMNQVELANESVQKAVTGSSSAVESSGDNPFRIRNPSVGAAGAEQNRSRAGSESVPTVSASQANTPSRKVGGQYNQYASDAKDVQRLDEHIPLIAEEDDLEYTLDNWLTQQKRGVTQRRKHGHGGLLGTEDEAGLADDAPIEDAADGYHTLQKYERMYESQAKGEALSEEVQDDNLDFYTSGTYAGDSKDQDLDQRETVDMSNGNNVVRGKYMGNDVEVVGLQCMLAQALMGDGDED